MKLLLITIIFLIIAMPYSLSAERDPNYIPFEFEIFPPVSTSLLFSGSDILRHSLAVGLVWSDAYAVDGIQLAGLVSTTDKMKGIQIGLGANICNVLDGAQLSFAFNKADDMEGLQLSPINIADSASGLQLGLINYSRINDGITIGLISYVDEAGIDIDAWIDETGFINLGLRSGTKNFHNTISYGIRALSNTDQYLSNIAYMLGGNFYLEDNYYFITDVSFGAIWDQDLFGDAGYYTVYKLRTLLAYRFTYDFSIYGGPTFNYLVAGYEKEIGFIPMQFSCVQEGTKQYVSWIGFVFGFRY